MQRRTLFSLLPFAAGALAPMLSSATEPPGNGLLPRQYDDFTDWLVAARSGAMSYLNEFGADDTERFMRVLSLWACAMPFPSEPTWQPLKEANAPIDLATIAGGRPFVVSAFRMAPGALLPLHCHPGGGGITLCTSGSLSIQHFELFDDQPAFSKTGAQADVRQVQVARLAHHQATMFTPTMANLHQFHAGPSGAAGVEIAVQWQGAGEFSFLRLEQPASVEHFSAGARLTGKWVGMQLAAAYP